MSADPTDIQQRWKGVAKHFPLWRFAIDMFFDVNAWRLIGADITTMMVESKHTRRAVQTLDGASPEALDALAILARVNEQRSSDIFKAVFLSYVSLPLAMAAMLSDAAPEALNAFVTEYMTAMAILLIGSLVFPIIYFCGNWRAKQIAWTIDLYRAGAVTPLPPKAR